LALDYPAPIKGLDVELVCMGEEVLQAGGEN
jgi:hypothetical protein